MAFFLIGLVGTALILGSLPAVLLALMLESCGGQRETGKVDVRASGIREKHPSTALRIRRAA